MPRGRARRRRRLPRRRVPECQARPRPRSRRGEVARPGVARTPAGSASAVSVCAIGSQARPIASREARDLVRRWGASRRARSESVVGRYARSSSAARVSFPGGLTVSRRGTPGGDRSTSSRRRHSAPAFDRAVSSFRTSQSSGKTTVWTSRPSTSTGVPCVPTTRRRSRARPPGSGASGQRLAPLVELDERLGEPVQRVVFAASDVEHRRGDARLARGARGTPGRATAARPSASRQPGESKPLPCPSTCGSPGTPRATSPRACRADRSRSARSEAAAELPRRLGNDRPAPRGARPPRRRSSRASATARTTGGRPGRGARRGAPIRRGPSGARGGSSVFRYGW